MTLNKTMQVARRAALLLAFIIATPLLASEVKVKGVGVAPITKDKASAKRVSRELAKRDAVERAVGAEVQAEAIPAQELMRITATTSGKLKFSILYEGAEDGVYITEIEAVVEIPADLAAKYPKSVEEEQTGYKPLIQKFPQGELNWRDGYLVAKGVAKKKGTDQKAIAEARRAAQVDAYGVVLQMISGINFDPEETVKDRIKKVPTIEYRIKGLIRGAEVIEESSPDNKTYQVTVKVPLRGIKGVQRAFTETMNLESPEPEIPPKKVKGEDIYTGVIVDARGLSLMPAVFPQIVDEDGNVVYDANMVESPALTSRSMAAYVVGEEEPIDKPRGAFLEPGNYLVVPALAVIYQPAPGISADMRSPEFSVSSLLNPLQTIRVLAQAARRVVVRQGARPVRTTAVRRAGPTRSRIVVSKNSSAQIRTARRSNDFLRQGRVVVITDSMIGGTEGKYRMPSKLRTPAR